MTITRWIAIDFGTSRTKVAYRPLSGGRAELMRFGDDHDLPYVPSLFHLPAGDGPALFGAAAEEMLEDDPAGVVDVLKRRLRGASVRANGRAVPPRELLTLMFAELRGRAGREIAGFGGQPPEGAVLTVPAAHGIAERELLKAAALAAEFSTVELMDEPVAAARGWLAETHGTEDQVVVLDCGGGTVDWAWVRREDGRLRIEPSCPPGGVEGLGGHDIDLGLMEEVERELAERGVDCSDFGVTRRVRLLARLRRVKEAVSRGREPGPVRVGGQAVHLTAETVRAIVQGCFVAQTLSGFRSYLDRVRRANGGETPPVLLVGGGAGLPGLSAALAEGEDGCRVVGWDRGQFGPVLGALAGYRRDSSAVPNTGATAEAPRRNGGSGSRPSSRRRLVAGTLFRDVDESWCPEMVVLPQDRFWMGSPDDEPERDSSHEGPRHCVEVGYDMALGTCAVSFAEWDAYTLATGGHRPSDHAWGRGDLPVINVSWVDAQDYLSWLNDRLGLTDRPDRYRLPSEAEWEFGCRGGTETPFWWGRGITPNQANYRGDNVYSGGGSKGEYREKTLPVRSFSANLYGLYQMHGNVWEWCADVWHCHYTGASVSGSALTDASKSSARIVRGGSWCFGPRELRSANRRRSMAIIRRNFIGFRVARTLIS